MQTHQPAALSADLILLHAPSVYDFRERDDVLFAFLSDSDSVDVTSIFEMYPLGFFAIQQALRQRGLRCEIVNIASLMLQHADLDVDRLLGKLEAPVFGIDLHWMAHSHGAIELAERVKAAHPQSLTLFGGISATLYAEELIEYAAVDLVMRGFDTLGPSSELVATIASGERALERVPNLLYKRDDGHVVDTGFSVRPPSGRFNDAATDWKYLYQAAPPKAHETRFVMSLPSGGCPHDCGWCGGSAWSTERTIGSRLLHRPMERVIEELRSLAPMAQQSSLYALHWYAQSKARQQRMLATIAELGIKSVSFELHDLPSPEMTRMMARATRAFVYLSPESHDPRISTLAGRGTYTMEQMQRWIARAFDEGIEGVMVWFFIGMPEQTPESVFETVSFCGDLLRRFPRRHVVPLICPMVPFLDPASRFFEEPEPHGYRVFFRSLRAHREAMVQPTWHRRLNYETRWLSRRQLQDVSYQAVDLLTRAKGELGLLPSSKVRRITGLIDETQSLLGEIEASLERDGALAPSLRATIGEYNQRILSRSQNQISARQRRLGDRWYDDHAVSNELVTYCCRER